VVKEMWRLTFWVLLFIREELKKVEARKAEGQQKR